MGRAFEFRKNRKMKRWNTIAKAFTKFGKEIAIAVKQITLRLYVSNLK